MGGDRGTRHRCKDHLYSLEQELRHDYGLSVIESRALVQRYIQLLDELQEDEGVGRRPGQVRVVAVATGQPAGRPLSSCVTLPVLVTLVAPSDAEVQRTDGSIGLRQARLVRITHEAWGQGGLLSYEDLSLLLAVDVSTVQRLVRRCRAQGLQVPTRGWVADIGPGSTHKARVIELYFRGLHPQQIASYTAHALSSVERYLGDFARVLELSERGYPRASIIRITALSPRTVREYLALHEQYSGPAHQPVLDVLRQRFTPIFPDHDQEDH